MSGLLKQHGNSLFNLGRFEEATAKYTAAINVDPQNHQLYCNRSASRLRSGPCMHAGALSDAMTAVSLNPYWPKCYLRLGNVLRDMSRFNEAVEAYVKGLRSGDQERRHPSILRDLKLLLTNRAHTTRKTGVGGYIQFLINTCDIVRVAAEEERCWRLASGRVAKKTTYGFSWLWYPFEQFPKPLTNRFHPGVCESRGRRRQDYLTPQHYDDPEHTWHLAKSKNWGPWSCCGGAANSPPCTARLSKRGGMKPSRRITAGRTKMTKRAASAPSVSSKANVDTTSTRTLPAAVSTTTDGKTDNKSGKREPPAPFLCPLTLEVMTDPVMDPEGNTFDRVAITKWLLRNQTSPISRTPMRVDQLIPNRSLKCLIEAFQVIKF